MRDREADFSLERPRPRYDAIVKIAKRMGLQPPPFDETDMWLTPAMNHPNFVGAIELRLLKRAEPARPRRTNYRGTPKPTSSVVYLVRAGEHIKIGVARDLKRRLVGLQTGNPLKLEVVLAFRGDMTVENSLHARFAALRAHGEWFRAEQPLLDFVAEMKRRQSR